MELVEVHPQLVPAGEPDGLAVGDEPAVRAGALQGREGAPLRRPRPCLPVLRPKRARQRVAGLRLPRDGKVRDQGERLARVHLQRRAVTLYARGPEQVERRTGHSLPAFVALLPGARKARYLPRCRAKESCIGNGVKPLLFLPASHLELGPRSPEHATGGAGRRRP